MLIDVGSMICATGVALIVIIISMLGEDVMAHVFERAPYPISWIATLVGYTFPWCLLLVHYFDFPWWIMFVIPTQRHVVLTLYVKYADVRYKHKSSIQGNALTIALMELPSMVWFFIAAFYTLR